MEPVSSSKTSATSEIPPTRLPHLDLIYRLECDMLPEEQVVGNPTSSQHARIILPISGGSFRGPRVAGIIVNASGADWATSLPNESFMKLDARYTLKTDDGYHIYVRSKGIFQPEPSSGPHGSSPPTDINQDQADWFTRLQFETGQGPYEWMNYVFAVGVLTMVGGKIVIDAYRLTNFGGREAVVPMSG